MTIPRPQPARGLTMVELLCVMAIIAILVALSLGPIMKAFAHAKHVVGN
jgi:prepilin-type N-terminal cleavage/methylation domain-containing protein